MADKKKYDEDVDMKLKAPDLNKIDCRDCYFREPDKGGVKGALKNSCEVYKGKPQDVLWKGAECDYYISDDEMAE